MAERSDSLGRVRVGALAAVLALCGVAFGRQSGQGEGRRQTAAGGFA
ncbi:MAG TPA: hypothetical protein VGX48_09005 [Pyrinomonadaceae bacterium]|jgi:hypothetical protein|nr:hypothetical protein [Pyrinomonadaceae bacterium]